MATNIPGFTFTGMYIYECAGISHTIAEYRHDMTGIEFNLIPGGSFMMGSGDEWEQPVHPVNIEPFLMAKYECTQAQYKFVTGTNPSHFRGKDRPVEMVSWNDALAACRKVGLELPSEAQWEYACRAGSTADFYFGDDEHLLDEYGWHWGNSDEQTHPVGQKRPNAFGLYDMHGNVWEWCQDTWHDSYTGVPSDGLAWVDDGSNRVFRGGSWFSIAWNCRSTIRYRIVPGSRRDFRGFRWSSSSVL